MAVEMPGFEVPQIYETAIAMRDRAGEARQSAGRQSTSPAETVSSP